MKNLTRIIANVGIGLLSAVAPITKAEESTPTVALRYFVENIPGDALSNEFYNKPDKGIWPKIASSVRETYKKQGINVEIYFVDEVKYLTAQTDNQNLRGTYTSKEHIENKWWQFFADAGLGDMVARINGAISREVEQGGISREDAEKKAKEECISPLLKSLSSVCGSGFSNSKSLYMHSLGIIGAYSNNTEKTDIVAQVVAHETGHTLGLPHYTNSYNNVMYPARINGISNNGRFFTVSQLDEIKQNIKLNK